MAVELNIVTWRHVPFGGATGNGDIVIVGADYSAATYAMHIRPAPGHAGSPLIALSNAAPASQGISASYDPAYVMPDGSGAVGATTVRIEIDESSIEALATAAKPESAAVFYYDLHFTPAVSGARKDVVAFGTFTVLPGVTNA